MLSLLLSLLMLSNIHSASSTGVLSVELTNISQSGGTLRVALYKPGAKFGSSEPDYFKNVAAGKAKNQTVTFEVPAGRYALAVYHDLNDNNELDKNLVGYPKEPFGFSNNYRPRLSAPDFDDCAFEHKAAGTSVSIRLID